MKAKKRQKNDNGIYIKVKKPEPELKQLLTHFIADAALIGVLFYNRIQGLNLSRDQILWGIIGAGLIAILFLVRV